MQSPRAEHVGVLAMEMYVPSRFVSLTDLETADNCKGKYTGIFQCMRVNTYSQRLPLAPTVSFDLIVLSVLTCLILIVLIVLVVLSGTRSAEHGLLRRQRGHRLDISDSCAQPLGEVQHRPLLDR